MAINLHWFMGVFILLNNMKMKEKLRFFIRVKLSL